MMMNLKGSAGVLHLSLGHLVVNRGAEAEEEREAEGEILKLFWTAWEPPWVVWKKERG